MPLCFVLLVLKCTLTPNTTKVCLWTVQTMSVNSLENDEDILSDIIVTAILCCANVIVVTESMLT